MWPYWLLFFVPAFVAAQESLRRKPAVGTSAPSDRLALEWWVVGITLTLVVGWRYQVGGDWVNYLSNFKAAATLSKYADWWWDDPGYRLLEWLAIQSGWGIAFVNLLAGAIFSFGLVKFCVHLPRPWLSLAVSVPYLVIILGMGYSRQGAALGCLMVGLVALGQGRVREFLLWTVLGATLHKSAVLLLPMAALAASQKRLSTTLWMMAVFVLSFFLLLDDSVDKLQKGYLEAQYQSEGALIRLLMNALAAVLLLWKRERFSVTLPQGKLWLWFSWFALGLLAVFFVSPSSTAVDRVGLYLLPLQLMVFSFLPEVFGRRSGKGNQGWVLAVLGYYAVVQFVWLNFAGNAFSWLPYRWYPVEWLSAY